MLGAGIMGGGISYQSASRGVPVLMKDIAPKALEAGIAEATKLLEKQVERGKLTTGRMAQALAAITPTLSYGDFGAVDFVVEAVVENEAVKKKVLAEVEALPAGARDPRHQHLDDLGDAARDARSKRPESFCGMHFFNPVPRMPLVEVIRGEKSSDAAIATTVAYAQTLGKTPIVVKDCGGFLVNRVLFPYFAGFELLLRDGVDYERIDKAMEKWGWPMGPALLIDVVGIDTCVHADAVLADAYPDRMRHEGQSATAAMVAAGRLGQKSGKGFYAWKPEKKGPAQQAERPRGPGDRGRARQGPRGGVRRRDRAAADAADAARVVARARGRDRRDAGRGGHGARLRPRLSAVPRRDLPLGRRREARGALEGRRSAPLAWRALRADPAAHRPGRLRPGLPHGVTP